MKYGFLISFNLFMWNCFSQQDNTIVKGKHYNTVFYYAYFDYKTSDTIKNNYLIGAGNFIDSVKTGSWTYYYHGKMLARGRYKKGYKKGNWKYLNYDGTYFIVSWRRSDKIKDIVDFKDSMHPKIIDIDSETNRRIRINGAPIPTPNVDFL